VNFNDLYNLILEGDGDPLYDLDPKSLNVKDIDNLEPNVARKLSERDDNKREFTIKTNNQILKTTAKSKNEAIGNIGYRLAKAANVFPNLVIYKMHQNNVKVFDSKWKIRY
jgi:hypothetical protein